MSETEDIDGQQRAMRPKGAPHYERKGNDSGRRIQEALIVAAILALIGAVWQLGQTTTLLKASQESQRRDMDRLERRQDMLEGRITRGGPDALDQQ